MVTFVTKKSGKIMPLVFDKVSVESEGLHFASTFKNTQFKVAKVENAEGRNDRRPKKNLKKRILL